MDGSIVQPHTWDKSPLRRAARVAHRAPRTCTGAPLPRRPAYDRVARRSHAPSPSGRPGIEVDPLLDQVGMAG
jgi:hypothetical protein